MSIKPILFNTEMVKAILDGRKTVIRRNPFKFEMKDGYNPEWSGYSLGEYYTGHIETGVCLYSRGVHDVWGVRSNVVKPKYQTGDILYVRETWGNYGDGTQILYKADFANGEKQYMHDDGIHMCDIPKWHPSIHMPKEAARIFLKVTDVRVERLQDMKIEDISKEGFSRGHGIDETWYERGRKDFSELWDSTVKEDWQKFASSPWVWVIEFERCEKPEGWC